MTEAPKAPSGPPDLDLYALAQVRVDEVLKAFPKCRECKGDCRPPERPVLGRSDWPTCPVAMVTSPAWTEVAQLYVGAQVSPIAGFPRCMTAWGFDGLVALRSAVRQEDARQQRQASRPNALPRYAGLRNKREEG